MNSRVDDYLDRVERLLSDIDPDDRESLLADLRDQMDKSEDPAATLGPQEDFVTEYRRSAGLPVATAHPTEESAAIRAADLVSILVLALAVLLLFSFGGQIVLGPPVLVAGWFLARGSVPWLRTAWTIVAGLMAGELAYIFLSRLVWPNRAYPLFGILLVAGAIAAFFHNTTRTPPGPSHLPLAIMWVGLVGAALLLATSMGRGGAIGGLFVAFAALALGGGLMYLRR